MCVPPLEAVLAHHAQVVAAATDWMVHTARACAAEENDGHLVLGLIQDLQGQGTLYFVRDMFFAVCMSRGLMSGPRIHTPML